MGFLFCPIFKFLFITCAKNFIFIIKLKNLQVLKLILKFKQCYWLKTLNWSQGLRLLLLIIYNHYLPKISELENQVSKLKF
jgi:hypothetical protein